MTAETLLADREALLARIAAAMSPVRFQHVLGVEQTALALADRYGCDPHQASLAALLHDYAKEVPDQVFHDLIARYELDQDLLCWDNAVWHGVVGAYKIAEDFGLEDPAIFQAIQRHTLGAAEMSLLDKILYVADYIEPGRDFPGVDEARRLAASSLDAAVAYEAKRTLAYLQQKNRPIHPQTLATYQAYQQRANENPKRRKET